MLFFFSSYLPMVLVANKTDLKNDRNVASREGEELAASLKVYAVLVVVCICNQNTSMEYGRYVDL